MFTEVLQVRDIYDDVWFQKAKALKKNLCLSV